ncbi:hypothetical protein GCM10022380_08940 [Amycolatopsis tucumanensis]|uniref:DUF11 domain-containing protein n=1 Tax=Amycolatopsis tucumanensis TaxID=401106 RepID=A0ABP7HMC5_9PSEU
MGHGPDRRGDLRRAAGRGDARRRGGRPRVGPVSQPYQDGQTYNTIAAKLQAPRPGCDDGTATVTVRSTVHLLGPTAGVGQNGFAKLGTDFDTAPGTNTTAGMPCGGTQTLETTVEVPAADLAAGNVKYWMILETYHGGSKAWEISDFSATYTYDTSTCADLGVTKSTEPSVDQVQQGERISYAVVVTNHGPGNSTGHTMTDPVPAGLVDVQIPEDCSLAGGVVTCTGGPLAAGESRTYLVTATAADVPAGTDAVTVTNTARVSGNETDPDTANNTSAAIVTVNVPMIAGGVDAALALGGSAVWLLRRRRAA